MTTTLKIASAQLNAHVGDLKGNMTKAREAFARAKAGGADILVLPEQFVIGYPAEDLVLKPAALEDCKAQAQAFAALTKNGPAVVYNLPWLDGGRVYNAALFMRGGEITDVRYKHHLPNYGVFDEGRVFTKGPLPEPILFKGITIGLPICEDLWQPGVASHLADLGAEILISPNGSPWRRTALSERADALGEKVHNEGLPLIYVNQIGGQDELVFDGSSFSMAADGTIVQALKSFVEDFDIVLGLSGGVDSAAVAAIAADALGPDRVWCVMMPSRYTAGESLGDAQDCAERIGCRYDVIAIKPAFDAFGEMLAPLFKDLPFDTTEENMQSRTRALTLMAISNKFGPMVVTTGNKSEMAVGYATLYGDMCGGYNPVKDIYKTELFKLCEWRNKNRPDDLLGGDYPIPDNIITKPPSAELRDDQKDSDSLPEYEVLDDILLGLIEQELPLEDIIARGHDPKVVKRIQHLLYIAEYKRRQAPPGVKIGSKNFGRDRRYPITNKYRDVLPDVES